MAAIPNLLDLAEARAGQDGDNLSALAMTWAEELLDDETQWISTVEMEPSTYKTTVAQFGQNSQTGQPDQGGYLSDEEIERAISEIRVAIKKHSG